MSKDIKQKINSELDELWNDMSSGYEDNSTHNYYLSYFNKRSRVIESLVDQLIQEKEAYKTKLFNQYFCEASQQGAGHDKAKEYANKRLNMG